MGFYRIRTLYIELTHACNQSCKHCYLDAGMQHPLMETDTQTVLHMLSAFATQGGERVILTGGEPLVRPDCFTILDHLEAQGMPFLLASNALMLNAARLERLSSYARMKTFFTSLLGSDAFSHRAVAGRDGFDRVLRAIRFFDERGIQTYVQATLVKQNTDQIDAIMELLLPYAHCKVKFTPAAGFGIKAPDESLRVPKEAFSDFRRAVARWEKHCPERLDGGNILSGAEIRAMNAAEAGKPLYTLGGFLAVRPNGDLSFSCSADNPYVFGNAREGLSIPVDERLRHYAALLRRADAEAATQAGEGLIEYDAAQDALLKRYAKEEGCA